MSTGLKHLAMLELADKRRKHPSVPERAIVKPKFEDRTANGLTHSIVCCFQLHGAFATRLSSTGTFRADIQRFVPSQQRTGLPDIMAVLNGRSIFVEVKTDGDRLSDDQKEAIADLRSAGAIVLIARDYETFWTWFQQFAPELVQQKRGELV